MIKLNVSRELWVGGIEGMGRRTLNLFFEKGHILQDGVMTFCDGNLCDVKYDGGKKSIAGMPRDQITVMDEESNKA